MPAKQMLAPFAHSKQGPAWLKPFSRPEHTASLPAIGPSPMTQLPNSWPRFSRAWLRRKRWTPIPRLPCRPLTTQPHFKKHAATSEVPLAGQPLTSGPPSFSLAHRGNRRWQYGQNALPAHRKRFPADTNSTHVRVVPAGASGEAEVSGDLRQCRSLRCECLGINEDIGRPLTLDGPSLSAISSDERESPSNYGL